MDRNKKTYGVEVRYTLFWKLKNFGGGFQYRKMEDKVHWYDNNVIYCVARRYDDIEVSD